MHNATFCRIIVRIVRLYLQDLLNVTRQIEIILSADEKDGKISSFNQSPVADVTLTRLEPYLSSYRKMFQRSQLMFVVTRSLGLIHFSLSVAEKAGAAFLHGSYGRIYCLHLLHFSKMPTVSDFSRYVYIRIVCVVRNLRNTMRHCGHGKHIL